MEKAHEKNFLKDNQFKTSKEMLNSVMYKVPLDKLYRVVASCNYNSMNYYCPVLVEVMDKEALKIHGEDKPFLLQVWNLKGEMVFERALKQPVANWNIANDVLMFQECSTDSNIWIVKMQ